MDTRMLAYEQADTVAEIATWANELIGKEAPGSPGYRVVRVIQFQFIDRQDGYAALILVEVEEWPDETSNIQVALKEADIEVIEQLTASIGEAPENETTLSEEL